MREIEDFLPCFVENSLLQRSLGLGSVLEVADLNTFNPIYNLYMFVVLTIFGLP